MKELQPEVRFEPELALYGGKDGLDLFRSMLYSCRGNLAYDGYILCEIGSGQASDALKAAEEAGFDAGVLQDLSGHDRVIVIRNPL